MGSKQDWLKCNLTFRSKEPVYQSIYYSVETYNYNMHSMGGGTYESASGLGVQLSQKIPATQCKWEL